MFYYLEVSANIQKPTSGGGTGNKASQNYTPAVSIITFLYDIMCRNFGGEIFEDLHNFAQLKIQISIILMTTTNCVF